MRLRILSIQAFIYMPRLTTPERSWTLKVFWPRSIAKASRTRPWQKKNDALYTSVRMLASACMLPTIMMQSWNKHKEARNKLLSYQV